MMNTLTESLKSELTRLDQEIGALQERRSKVAELLAPVLLSGGEKVKASGGRKTKTPQAVPLRGEPIQERMVNSSAKPKGWPKGMPRDKAKREEWFKTEAGQVYLVVNPGTSAT